MHKTFEKDLRAIIDVLNVKAEEAELECRYAYSDAWLNGSTERRSSLPELCKGTKRRIWKLLEPDFEFFGYDN